MNELAASAPMPAAEAYRLWAPQYDSTLNPLLSLEQRYVEPMLQSAAGCDVVDLGCGTGRWLKQLESAGARSIIGVDLSEAMLQEAARKVVSTTRLVCADCCRTPLRPNSFDWLLGSFLLSYVGDLALFAYEAARLCRPFASVILTDVHPDSQGYGWRRTFCASGQSIEIATQPYRIADLQAAMTRAGFTQASLKELPFEEPERGIFSLAGKPELYSAVEGLPVLFTTGFRRNFE